MSVSARYLGFSPLFRASLGEGTSIRRNRFVNRQGWPETLAGGERGRRCMRAVAILLAVVLVLGVLGGCLFLAFGNFSVPSTRVEKVLPDARFPK